MACEVVSLPGGRTAIVCGTRHSRKRCACGRRADLLCDWRAPGRKSGTCDKPICSRCATKPAPGKDLCPEHAQAFEDWKRARANAAIEKGAVA